MTRTRRRAVRIRKSMTPAAPRVAYGYVRASTEEQQDTLATQREAIEREFRRRLGPMGYQMGEVFTDSGVSGAVPLRDRPEGRRLVKALERGDAVIIHTLDRGFRSVLDCTDQVDRWDVTGVRLVVSDFDMDTGSIGGRMLLYIMSVVAEMERRWVSLRMKNWWKQRKAKGVDVSGSFPRYGFKRVGPKGNRRHVRWEEQRRIGAKIVELSRKGLSIDKMVVQLTKDNIRNPLTKRFFVRSAVNRWLKGEIALQEKERRAGEVTPNGNGTCISSDHHSN